MNEYLGSLIGLFATVTGIILAFLVLVYNSSKEWKYSAKKSLIDEVKNALECPNIPTEVFDLKKEFDEYETLFSDCKHGQVNMTAIENLQTLLKSKLDYLKTHKVETLSDEVVGKNLKHSTHIEKYHFNDIKQKLEVFNSANKFYTSFSKTAKIAIATPLIITSILLILGFYHLSIEEKYFDSAVIGISFIGLLFVYLISSNILTTLNQIDK